MARQRSQARTRNTARPSSKMRPMVLIATLVGTGFILALLVWVATNRTPVITNPATTDLDVQGRIIGSENAPVLIREYADFRCSHCRDAAVTLTPNLITEYVNTGLVRFEYIPVALLNDASQKAGQAALCAEEQDKFWTYHDHLFSRQGMDTFSNENLVRWATEFGMDETIFRACLDGGEYDSVMVDNMRAFEATSPDGNVSTPTFFVESEAVEGSVAWAQLKAVIDAQLADAGVVITPTPQ